MFRLFCEFDPSPDRASRLGNGKHLSVFDTHLYNVLIGEALSRFNRVEVAGEEIHAVLFCLELYYTCGREK